MRQRMKRWVADNVYQMRTTAASPVRRALAVATGVFIGCTPFLGLHIVIGAVVARFFRLDVFLVIVGCQVSYPVVAPFLYYLELQVGALLVRGRFLDLSLAALRAMSGDELGRFVLAALADLCVGSAVVGTVLALAAGFGTHALFRRMRVDAVQRVVEAAAQPYVHVSIFSWEWVGAKMRRDPVFLTLLRRGLLPDSGTLVDVGCGRGVLLALLAAAPRAYRDGTWPAGWAPPPHDLALHGIDHHRGVAEIARRALEGQASIDTGDATRAPLPAADAITMLDVLHYVRADRQERLLDAAAAALRPGGVLLVREADKGSGARFHATHLGERLMALLRGAWAQRFHFRSADEWARLFEERGLTVEVAPMSEGTPFANVLLIGRRPLSSSG